MTNPLLRQRSDSTTFPNNDTAMDGGVGPWPSVGEDDEFGERPQSVYEQSSEPVQMSVAVMERIIGRPLNGWTFWVTATSYLMVHECGYCYAVERGSPGAVEQSRRIADDHRCRVEAVA